MRAEVLFEEYREGVLECLHYGTACAADERGVIARVGQDDWQCFYRSASKPIQALPVLVRGLHRRYGLTDEEAAIFSGSHWGDEDHVRALTSILEKTGLHEEDMIMLPTYPVRPSRRDELLRANLPPRRIYHNCAGKHLALMLLARDLDEDVRDYWRRDSRTQKLVREMVGYVSGARDEEIAVGVDGCGVPVFAVPFHCIADAYRKLVCPEEIADEGVRRAVIENVERLHRYPNMIAGRDLVDTVITANPDLIAKSGALGVYAIGVRSKRMGIVFKTADGSHDEFAASAIEALEELGVAPETVAELKRLYPDEIVNDNREVVGRRRAVFRLFGPK